LGTRKNNVSLEERRLEAANTRMQTDRASQLSLLQRGG
jgi:hypothetical protein